MLEFEDKGSFEPHWGETTVSANTLNALEQGKPPLSGSREGLWEVPGRLGVVSEEFKSSS